MTYKNNYKPRFGDAKVSGRSHRELENVASTLRGFLHESSISIKDSLSKSLDLLWDIGLLSYEIVSDDEMIGESYAVTNGNHIIIKESVNNYSEDQSHPCYGRHRFTIAHEICHATLHKDDDYGFARQTPPTAPYESAEWQADTFAGYLLVSRNDIERFGHCPDLLSENANVSKHAAKVIIKNYRNYIL